MDQSEVPQSFADFSLSQPLLDAIARAGYQRPTPIQAQFIPRALLGQDLIGRAQTGTGKTAAFLLPLLHRLAPNATGPQVLILGPTRELVAQIAGEAAKFAGRIRTVAIMGGERYRGQIEGLAGGAQVVIGTPGRIMDHMKRGTLRLQHIRCVVLDEADRMLDIGFRPDIERILRQCPSERQTLLLSATLPPEVLRLSHRYLRAPELIDVCPEKLAIDQIRQTYFTVDPSRKFKLLKRVLVREQPRQAIIFTQTKRGADRLYVKLSRTKLGPVVAAMHGDLEQPKRNRIMSRFRSGEIRLLIATDVVSRGIDVTGISHIINYDLPDDPENYVHRIGRTGRMGKNGVAIAFACPDEGKKLTAIEALMNTLVEEDRIDGFEAMSPPVTVLTPDGADAPPLASSPPTATPVQPVFGRRTKRYSRAL